MGKKYDLNAPAFGEGAQKIADISEEKSEVVPEVKEEKVEKEEVVTPPEEEEKRVTYSRFKNVWSRAKEAEQAAEQARREAEEWRLKATQYEPKEHSVDMPSWWTKLYGDSEQSQDAWKVQERANSELREQITQEAREKALEAVKNERSAEAERIEENQNTIDENLEQLEAFVGRELTDKEQSSVLDIVDDYTPKDKDGNYLGATIPFEKAWEIYELKNQAALAPKKQARDKVAELNSSQSQGEPGAEEEKNKNFNPAWGAVTEAIRRRIG